MGPLFPWERAHLSYISREWLYLYTHRERPVIRRARWELIAQFRKKPRHRDKRLPRLLMAVCAKLSARRCHRGIYPLEITARLFSFSKIEVGSSVMTMTTKLQSEMLFAISRGMNSTRWRREHRRDHFEKIARIYFNRWGVTLRHPPASFPREHELHAWIHPPFLRCLIDRFNYLAQRASNVRVNSAVSKWIVYSRHLRRTPPNCA